MDGEEAQQLKKRPSYRESRRAAKGHDSHERSSPQRPTGPVIVQSAVRDLPGNNPGPCQGHWAEPPQHLVDQQDRSRSSSRGSRHGYGSHMIVQSAGRDLSGNNSGPYQGHWAEPPQHLVNQQGWSQSSSSTGGFSRTSSSDEDAATARHGDARAGRSFEQEWIQACMNSQSGSDKPSGRAREHGSRGRSHARSSSNEDRDVGTSDRSRAAAGPHLNRTKHADKHRLQSSPQRRHGAKLDSSIAWEARRLR
ncbi:MAG: hypothetical protein ACPIOQ_67490 [Promethearchaeia archaeon]